MLGGLEMRVGPNQLVAGRDTGKPLCYLRRELQPGFRSTFVPLARRRLQTAQLGSYDADGLDLVALVHAVDHMPRQ